MMRLILIFSLSLLFGCSLFSPAAKSQKRLLTEFYTPTDVEKFFLEPLPSWINFSRGGNCYRTQSIQYFNLDSLMKNFSMSYLNAIQLQATFNDQLFSAGDKANLILNNQKEKELLFLKSKDQVQNNIQSFVLPTFKRVHLILVDEALADARKEKKLKEFLKSSTQDTGVPVLISFCLTRGELEKRFGEENVKGLGSEIFSIFSSSGTRETYFSVDLEQLFLKNQKVILYSQIHKDKIDELKGNYQVIKY